MNIIKEGYPSVFQIFLILLQHILSQFSQSSCYLPTPNFFKKLEIEASYLLLIILSQIGSKLMRKTLRFFMIRVTIKFLRCTCLFEYSDEVKSLKVAINHITCNILSPIIHTLQHHCLPIYRNFLLKVLFQFEFGNLFPDCKFYIKKAGLP